ncbi:MAG: hypothetical protein ACYCU0_09255 [Solirubrobacteraceae bacterium]
MMRRASFCTALVGLAALGVPAAASAQPTVTLKAKILPVQKNLTKTGGPKYPGTGNILGAPAALEANFTISGTEYDGHPAPVREINVFLPKGTKLNTKGFATCPISNFENQTPEKCPKGSLAGPPGEANGVVDFGNSPVKEKVSVQSYFAAGGKLTFYIEGKSPAAIEKYASGTIKKTGGTFGVELATEVPLISTVPGGFDASAETIKVTVGAAIMKGKKLVSYGTVPATCPKGGFPGKAELAFGEGAESTWTHVTATTTVPCPKSSLKGKSGGKGKAKGKGKSKGKKKK